MQAPPRISLVSGVIGTLRNAIESGVLKDQLPNVRSLSRELRVSVPTLLSAIKALAASGHVQVTRGRPTKVTWSAANSEGLHRGPRRRVMFLSFPPENVKTTTYYREVVDRLQRAGYSIELHQVQRKTCMFGSPEFDRLVDKTRADCWVLVGGPADVQEFFAARKLPCLIAGSVARQGVSIPDFEIDYAAVYRHAAHQFLNLGHRRIHLIIGELSAAKNPESLAAFVSAVRERIPEQTYKSLIKIYDGTASHFKTTLQTLFKESEKPTALCVALVSRMIFAQSWLLSAGYRIPKDVSLICRDSDELIEFLVPTAAHYVHSGKHAVRSLVSAIIANVENTPLKEHTLIVPEFVKGDGLGPAPVGDVASRDRV